MKKKLRITHHSPAYWRATFDNPPLNLLDPEVTYELRELIDQMETSKELKVIVFDSADLTFTLDMWILSVQVNSLNM